MSGIPFRHSPVATTYWHDDPDNPGKVVLQKTFDRDVALDHAQYMRNEVKQTGELRKAMSVPAPLIFQWMREGKLGESAFVDGKLVVDMPTLKKLWAEYDGLRCMDKL